MVVDKTASKRVVETNFSFKLYRNKNGRNKRSKIRDLSKLQTTYAIPCVVYRPGIKHKAKERGRGLKQKYLRKYIFLQQHTLPYPLEVAVSTSQVINSRKALNFILHVRGNRIYIYISDSKRYVGRKRKEKKKRKYK